MLGLKIFIAIVSFIGPLFVLVARRIDANDKQRFAEIKYDVDKFGATVALERKRMLDADL